MPTILRNTHPNEVSKGIFIHLWKKYRRKNTLWIDFSVLEECSDALKSFLVQWTSDKRLHLYVVLDFVYETYMYVSNKFSLESFYNIWTDRLLSAILLQQIWNRRIKEYPTIEVTLNWRLLLLRECFERFHNTSDSMYERTCAILVTFMVIWSQSARPQSR